jgi:hypothetical protein
MPGNLRSLRFGEGSLQADQWVHQIGLDLKAGKVEQVIPRLKRLRPKSPQAREPGFADPLLQRKRLAHAL